MAYSNGKIAWVAINTADIHLLSLQNGCCCSMIKDDGVLLSHLALPSSKMAVATLTGEYRIMDFAKMVEHRVHLNLGNVDKVAGAKEALRQRVSYRLV